MIQPHRFGEADELPHSPASDPDWQESVFLHWFDRSAGVGGVHRIGHEVPAGVAALWCGVFGEDGTRFRRSGAAPLKDDDVRIDGFAAAGGAHRFTFDGGPRLMVEEDRCRLDLRIEDFYPRTDFLPSEAGSLTEDYAKAHFETSGRITGAATLGGRSYEIDGFCHRDHSWGARRWDTLLTHRWVSGTFGPQLSFGSITWHAVDGSLLKVGYLVRDGEVTYADDVDVVVHMEPDGLTHRGGEVTWRAAGEELLRLQAASVDGVLSVHHDIACVDTICRVTSPAGAPGHCDLEISTNPRNGRGPVLLALGANAEDGLTRRRSR